MPREGRRIAVACDNSANSEQALRWCITEVYRPSDVLILVHVATILDKEPAAADDSISRSRSTPSPRRKRPGAEEVPCLHASWQVLEKLKAVCEEYQVAYTAVLSRGDVQVSFTEAAIAQDCDLALIWSRCGRGSALQRARASFDHVGSVTSFSLQHLPCPVIMYRRGERESQRDVRPMAAPHLRGAKARSISQSPSPASKRTSSQRHTPRMTRRAASASPARAGDDNGSRARPGKPLKLGDRSGQDGGSDINWGSETSGDEAHAVGEGGAAPAEAAQQEGGRGDAEEAGRAAEGEEGAEGSAAEGGFAALCKSPPPPVEIPSPRGGREKAGKHGGGGGVGGEETPPSSGNPGNRGAEDKGRGPRRGWNSDLPPTPVAVNAPSPAFCSRRRIGVGVDGSEVAKAALRWVVRNYYRSY